MRLPSTSIAVLALAAAGCDYTGEWLFADVSETVPGVLHLGELTPADVASQADIDASILYSEAGATGTAETGGVTFTFLGTGGSVCAWVDPELVFWNQSVAAQGGELRYAYPDNYYDDGDIDLYGGFSVYYSGSPGETVGNFQVQYEDSLGNDLPVELNECLIAGLRESSGGHGGRGSPEYCTLRSTTPGVRYTVLMETFSTPVDDNRGGFGVLLTNGSCADINGGAGVSTALNDECVIRGEGIRPGDHDYREEPILSVGLDPELAWTNSLVFETAYCTSVADGGNELYQYCAEEAKALEAEERSCADDDVRCFCGIPADTPSGGAL